MSRRKRNRWRRRIAVRAAVPLLLLGVHLLVLPGSRAESGEDPAADPPPSSFERKGFSPKFSVHGFADVTLGVERTDRDVVGSSTESGFAVGEFDLYIVSQLSRNASFLGEAVIEVNEDGEFEVDLERLVVKYDRKGDRFIFLREK